MFMDQIKFGSIDTEDYKMSNVEDAVKYLEICQYFVPVDSADEYYPCNNQACNIVTNDDDVLLEVSVNGVNLVN